MLDPASTGLVPTAELLLYMADRAQHINSLIKPCLAEGKVVLCDRYFDATVVYQGFARGLDTGLICDLHRLIFDDLKPDITFLLDLAPRIGLARAWKQLDNGTRSGTESRFEEETLSFHEKVRAGYLELARRGTRTDPRWLMPPGMKNRCRRISGLRWLNIFRNLGLDFYVTYLYKISGFSTCQG